MKPLLVICFALLCKIQVSDYLSWMSRDLNKNGNLPHRSLGMSYSAYLLEPHRIDYAEQYLTQWTMSTANFKLIEGQHKPVVPLFAGKEAMEHIEDDRLLAFSHMLRAWNEKKRQQMKLTITKEENGEKLTARIE